MDIKSDFAGIGTSVFYGHNFIKVRCVGMASSATRYYCKGHFCDQFFTKFNDTESVGVIGNPSEASAG